MFAQAPIIKHTIKHIPHPSWTGEKIRIQPIHMVNKKPKPQKQTRYDETHETHEDLLHAKISLRAARENEFRFSILQRQCPVEVQPELLFLYYLFFSPS
jgi:hypothetical protein